MTRVAGRMTALVLAAVCCSGGPRLLALQGQPPPPPTTATAGQRAGQRPGRAGNPGPITNPTQASDEVQEMLNALALHRAQVQLNLSNEQYAAFFPRMKQLQDLRVRHQRERRRMLNQLRVLTGPQAPEGTDDVTLDARTKALDALELQMVQDEQKAMGVLDSGLTAWQRARFRVFEEMMENEKLKMLAKVLQTTPTAPATVKK